MDNSDACRILPVPQPSSADAKLPQRSESKLVKETNFILSFGTDDHAERFSKRIGGWISTHDPLFLAPDTVIPYARFLEPGHPRFLDPGAENRLCYSIHWQLVFSQALEGPAPGGAEFTKHVRFDAGRDGSIRAGTTGSIEALVAELGHAGEDVSGTLSTLLDKPVAISNNQVVLEAFTWTVSPGATAVVALWQLVEEFKLVDKDGILLFAAGSANCLWKIYDYRIESHAIPGNQALASVETNEVLHKGVKLQSAQKEFTRSHGAPAAVPG